MSIDTENVHNTQLQEQIITIQQAKIGHVLVLV